MEQVLYNAVRAGSVIEVKCILEHNSLNINWANEDDHNSTVLHCACSSGYDSIVVTILAHPDINVNQKNTSGATPFMLACFKGNILCIRLLLKDPRVNVNEPMYFGTTPLLMLANNGDIDSIKWWISSGREIKLGKKKRAKTNAIKTAKRQGHTEVFNLLSRFETNPMLTRHAVWVQLGCYNELAADLFALVIFLCDDLLRFKNRKVSRTTRFFTITTQLPMELQMLVCHRTFGSTKHNIPITSSESAFRELARSFL